MSADSLQNVEAEAAVLGSMMRDPEYAIAKVASVLAPDDFTSSGRGRLFQTLVDMHERGSAVDLTTVGDRLTRIGALDAVGGALELARMLETVPSGANVLQYATIVQDLARRREIKRAAEQLVYAASDPGRPIDGLRLELTPARSTRSERRFLGVDELLAAPDAKVSFLVDRLIAEAATTLLVAKPKAGKTTLVFAILRHLERREAFADRDVSEATAIVLSEEGHATLADKVRRFGLTRTRFLTRSDMLQSRSFRGSVAAATAEAKRVGARLLVVDSLSAWARLGPDAEKDAGSMAQAMEPLLGAAANGLAVLVVHHARKMDGAEGDAVRGSGAIFQSVETLMELRRVDPKAAKSTARVIAVTSRIDGMPEELCLDLRGDDYLAIASAAEAKEHELRGRVLAAVSGEWSTREEIRERVGANAGETAKALAALLNDGAIVTTGAGRKRDPKRFRRNGISEQARPVQPESSSSVAVPPYRGWNGGTDSDECSVPPSQNGMERQNRKALEACGEPVLDRSQDDDGSIDALADDGDDELTL